MNDYEFRLAAALLEAYLAHEPLVGFDRMAARDLINRMNELRRELK